MDAGGEPCPKRHASVVRKVIKNTTQNGSQITRLLTKPPWLIPEEWPLRASGIKITATWIDEAGEGQTTSYAELADRCIREVAEANAVLLYCTPGEMLEGALIEVGAALALGKRVLCVGDCPSLSRVFKAHPLWSTHLSIEAVLAVVQKSSGTL